MTLRPCLVCGEPTDGPRCPEHTVSRPRDPQHVHFNRARWKNLSARLRRLSPFCELCSATADLTVDHIVRVADRPEWTYETANLRVICRTCNGRLAATPATPEQVAEVEARITARKRRVALTPRGDAPRVDHAPPARQANFRSHTPGGYR